MKTIINNYTFNHTSKKITFSDYSSILLSNILTVINVTAGIIIYLPNKSSIGGSVIGNDLTLNYDTTQMNDSDSLLIYYDDPGKAALEDVVNEISNKDLMIAIKNLLIAIANPSYVDKSVNAIRNQVQSGTITTVSTVSALTNVSQIDSIQGRLLMMNSNVNAWANSQRRTIS